MLDALSRKPHLDLERKEEQALDMANSLDKEHLIYLYPRWTVTADTSFSAIPDNRFIAFLEFVNTPANERLPLSNTTIKKRARLLYERKRRIRHLLVSAFTSVRITCDGWSSSNHLLVFGYLVFDWSINKSETALQYFISEDFGPAADRLDPEDCLSPRRIRGFLKPFYTMMNECHGGSICHSE